MTRIILVFNSIVKLCTLLHEKYVSWLSEYSKTKKAGFRRFDCT